MKTFREFLNESSNEKYTYGDNVGGFRRIVALKNFSDVKKGDVGGWVKGYVLSQKGDCWIYDEAKVEGALIQGDAKVFDKAVISGHFVDVEGNAEVGGNAMIVGNAFV